MMSVKENYDLAARGSELEDATTFVLTIFGPIWLNIKILKCSLLTILYLLKTDR